MCILQGFKSFYLMFENGRQRSELTEKSKILDFEFSDLNINPGINPKQYMNRKLWTFLSHLI